MPQKSNKIPKEESLSISPLSNKKASSGDEQKKQKQYACHAVSFETCTCKQKQQRLLAVWLVSMQNIKEACNSGVLSTGSDCGQNGLCKFLVICTGLCPIDFVHPCMLGAFAPTKLLCEQVAKTSGSTAKDKYFTNR